MRQTLICAALLAGCAGTDAPFENNATNGRTSQTSNPNNVLNNSTSGVNNTVAANNTTSTTGTANNTTVNNTTSTSGPTNNVSNNTTNETPEWRALVANADLTGDTSSWNLVVFDGTEANVTVPQSFGTGNLAVAASGERGYVVDLDSGMVVVVDAMRGTEIDTLDLKTTNLDAVTADNGTLAAASAANGRIVHYSEAVGDFGPVITLPAASGGTLFVRDIVMDGDLIAGVVGESAPFPTSPQVFLAQVSSASLIDADPSSNSSTIEVRGAGRMDKLGGALFALGTESNGIQIVRQDGAAWVVDQELMPSSAFGGGEVGGVVMADGDRGVALTYSSGFAAYWFDAQAQTATKIDGFALPSPLIEGDASGDGQYFFIGDYGIRDQQGTPWGVGVVDATGTLVDHVETDATLPPTAIVTLN